MADVSQTLAELRSSVADSLAAASTALEAGDVRATIEHTERAVHLLRGIADVDAAVRRMADTFRKAP